ncbi:hypothetical protein ACA910_017198 [Epithemia clementina (nom. ined.)]
MVAFKEIKESFVTGHEGTSPQELLLVCFTVPIGIWCGSLILGHFRNSVWVESRPITVEAIIFWVPMILCQSNFLYPWGVVYLFVELVVATLLEWFVRGNKSASRTAAIQAPRQQSLNQNNDENQNENKNENMSATEGEMTGYVTTYRSSMMYLTFIAILAVDFRLFPRRFVKTETHGYGLMDLGAASFVIAAGFVSPKAKRGRTTTRRQEHSWSSRSFSRRIIPLWTIGLLRLVTHKGIEYQEHASEYGIHWNFFFTLAILQTLGPFLPGPPSWILPTLLMTIYQSYLSYGGVQEWIEQGRRECDISAPSQTPHLLLSLCYFFAANREGVLGCIGYLSLYLFSEWIGSIALWSSRLDKSTSNRIMWGVWACLFALWRILVGVGIKVSRRSTNLSFCCWSLMVNVLLLQLVRTVYQRHGQVSIISQALNRHGLICFVLANLLTGAVNLSINTLEVQETTAIAILLAYMTSIGVIAILLEAITNTLKQRGSNQVSKTD